MSTRGVRSHTRAVLAAMVLTVLISGCTDLFRNVAYPEEGACDLEPVGAALFGLGIGVPRVAAGLCGYGVVVDGQTYEVSSGEWLDEEALVLEEHGRITAANVPVGDPTVYALPGVDPRSLLLYRLDCAREDCAALGAYGVLHLRGYPLTGSVCRYTDPEEFGYPYGVCPIETGRTYHVSLVVECGFEVPIGPFGGELWTVVDPPAATGDGTWEGIYSGQGVDFGYLELADADHATYRSEFGAILQLLRITDAEPSATPCPNRFQ